MPAPDPGYGSSAPQHEPPTRSKAVETMAGSVPDAPEPDAMEIFDDASSDWLTCLVCGSLVARDKDFPQVHWDWHAATHGA